MTTATPATAETYAAYARAERTITVGSEGVRALAYDAESNSLFVTWAGGKTYAYEGVGPDVWDQIRTADSKGGFANQIKRSGYTCRGPLL